jgi:archaeosine synthase
MFLITAESLHRPEVVRWHNRMLERYRPPQGIELTIILPCSAKKPYSKSKSHRHFKNYIIRGARGKMSLVHEIILTSPLGLVPRELENLYPAAHYDVPVTGHWSNEEMEVAARLLADYLSKTGKPAVAHVKGAYREICSSLDIEMTGGGHSESELRTLAGIIANKLSKLRPVERNPKRDVLRAVCDYQFGRGAGRTLIPEDAVLKGRQIFHEGIQIAAVNPENGFLALTIAGGELLREYGANWVEVSFRPDTRSIFAVGIKNADQGIRPNDEVVVLYGGKVTGVGRAVISGAEMTRATRGLAIQLRHRA